MYARPALAMAVLIGLAGCAGAADPALPAQITLPGTGTIVGLATDEDFLPIAGAAVSLLDASASDEIASTVSDAQGGFTLAGLEAGGYVVLVSAPGHAQQQASVEVLEEHVAQLHVVLPALAGDVPHVVVTPWVGIFGCAFSYGVTPVGGCTLNFTGLTGKDNTSNVFHISDGAAAILSETIWGTFEEVSVYLDIGPAYEGRHLNTAWGHSPQRMSILPGQVYEQSATSNLFFEPMPEESFPLLVILFYLGSYGDLLRPADPVCGVFNYPRCAGVGGTFDLRFEHWLSVFMYDVTEDLDTYTVLPDQ